VFLTKGTLAACQAYSVLQCVAVCCSPLQCAAVCCSALPCDAVCWQKETLSAGKYYSVLQCIQIATVCYGVVCCNVS